MLKSMSFNEAFDFMLGCHAILPSLEEYLGESCMEVLSDAINLYAQNPEAWGCDEDGDMAALLALMFHRYGFNSLKPEHDVTLKFLVASQDG